MASRGEQAVSCVLRDYEFPGPFQPMPHQLTMVNDLVVNQRFYNLCEMGGGKTAASIWAALYLHKIGRVKKILIVGTLSGLEETWSKSIFQLAMPLTATVIHGSSRATKVKRVAQAGLFSVINFDGVVSLLPELMKQNYDMIIVDESRTYANPSTSRWKSLRKLIKDDTICHMLTGTPRPRSSLDIFGQCKMLTPWTVPSSRFAWRNMVQRQTGMYLWEERPEANDICARAMMPGRVVRKADVLRDLPLVTYNYVPCQMSEQQAAYYKEMKKESLVKGAGGDITAVNAAVLMGKLAQIASGCVYDEHKVVQRFDVGDRLANLHRLVDESASGTIVFAPYRASIEMLMETLGPLGFKAITGDTPLGERTAIFAGVNDGTLAGVVAVPSTMSHGITLTGASSTIWWAPTNSNEIFSQANARTDRLGQKHPVSIYMLFASSVERSIYQNLQKQGADQESMLQIFNSFLRS